MRPAVLITIIAGGVTLPLLCACCGLGSWLAVSIFKQPGARDTGSFSKTTAARWETKAVPTTSAKPTAPKEVMPPVDVNPPQVVEIFEAKADPKPEEFLGKWSGKWDNIWRVQFTVTQDAQTKQFKVAYDWEEVVGQPFHSEKHNAVLAGNVLRLGPITISLSSKDPNQALAVGNFINRRMARLVRDKGT
jgi:hypothetical protein